MQGPLVLLVVSTICLIGANSKHSRGECPQVQIQQNFSLSEYMGMWYEIEHLPTHFDSGSCIAEKYSLEEDGWVVLITEEKLENGTLQYYRGDMVPTSLNVTANLQYRLGRPFKSVPDFAEFSFVTYMVLTTDYRSYSLVYSCFPRDLARWKHVEYAWILSRERHLAENVTNHLHEILNSYGIKDEELIKTSQENCPKHT
ncbi:apolipoprotein D-like [Pristis pectinata]|uniref:apolipoprotein D-like n=1 Tax=Pristis pectinata TaxID=685728 RepID=UPI00223D16ED|nr:apolipoprotein D-like [Pristis pectinata]